MRKRILFSLGVWLALACVLWLDQALPVATVPIQGAFIGAIIAGITAAFSWLADKAVTIAITVAQAAVMIGTAIAQFAVLVGQVFLKVWNFMGKFWSSTLRPFVQWTWRQIEQLAASLQRIMAPVVKFLEAVRREFLQIYDKWFAPIFDTIDITRRILRVLATFRLEWARELDRKLAELEDRMLAPITFVMRKINEAMDIVNRIVTIDGLLQRLTLLKSLLTYERDVWAVWWTSLHRREVEKGRRAPGAAVERTPSVAAAEVIDYLRGVEVPGMGAVEEYAAGTMAGLLRAAP